MAKKKLGVRKAREIVKDRGFRRLGNGYDSPRQRRMIHARASGKKLTRLRRA